MESVKEQIVAFADWSDEEKGRAINRLNESNIKKLTALPDAVLKAALEDLLTQGKYRKQRLSILYPVVFCQLPARITLDVHRQQRRC